MAEFVNYKKRSFTLPLGCKDLIDVVELSRRQTKRRIATYGLPPFEVREERFPTEGMAQVGRYVSMLLQSHCEIFTLSVTGLAFEFPVTLCRSRCEPTGAIVLVTKDAPLEQAIRTFFAQQGIESRWDDTPSELGKTDAARGLAYTLPSDPARAISLTIELLQRVYGLSEEAGLDFRYAEFASST